MSLGSGVLALVLATRGEAFSTFTLTSLHWQPAVVVVLVAAILGNWGAPALRLQRLALGQRHHLSFFSALTVSLTASFASALTPAKTGSAPVTAVVLSRLGLPLGRGTVIGVQQLLFDLIFFACALPLSLAYFLWTRAGLKSLALNGLSFVFIALLVVLAIFHRSLLNKSPQLFLGLARVPALARFRKSLHRFTRSYARALTTSHTMKRQTFLYLLLLTVLGYLANYLALWLLLSLYGSQVNLITLVLLMTVVSLSSNLAPTPGGSGFVEFVTALGLASLTTQTLAAPLLLWRVATFYLIFFLGPVTSWLIYRRGGVVQHPSLS